MKTKLLLLIVLLNFLFSQAQDTAQFLIDGTSEMFVLKQTGQPDIDLPAAQVYCRIENNGMIKIKIKTLTWEGNYVGKPGGWTYKWVNPSCSLCLS